MTWITGDDPLAARLAVRFLIPQNDWLAQALVGAASALQYSPNWHEGGTCTPETAAAVFRIMMQDVRVEMTSCAQIVCFPADNMQYVNQDPLQGASQWLKCDGQSLSVISYPELYAIIGTIFGGGGGVFNVPDLRGRVIIDGGTGSGLTPRALGATLGEETHQLDTSEIPGHDHSIPGTLTGLAVAPGELPVLTPNIFPGSTGSTGGDGDHNNMQPSIVLFYYIQAFP